MPADTYPFMAEGLFSTLTNVNFDPEALTDRVRESSRPPRGLARRALADKRPEQ